MRRILLSALVLGFAGTLVQAEPRYVDDRSTPESLVRSLYNAINRHEYARAWDYFEKAPAKSFDAYVKGFDDTDHVEVAVGQASAEGAAGSVYYEVPVAIGATDKKGGQKVFAGCYSLRQVNGSIQEPPNSPLRISKASLKPSQETTALGALPEKCGDAPVPSFAETLPDKVMDMYLNDAQRDDFCTANADIEAGVTKPEVFTFTFKQAGMGDNDPPSTATLFSFPCGSGAYNTAEFYYLNIDERGPERLSFAEPNFDFKYEDEEDAKLKSMALAGFSSSGSLVNSEFDPKTNSITSFSKWRGVGDASSSGTWVFSDGAFELKDYDVDPTYDEEINPIPVLKNGQFLPYKTP